MYRWYPDQGIEKLLKISPNLQAVIEFDQFVICLVTNGRHLQLERSQIHICEFTMEKCSVDIQMILGFILLLLNL